MTAVECRQTSEGRVVCYAEGQRSVIVAAVKEAVHSILSEAVTFPANPMLVVRLAAEDGVLTRALVDSGANVSLLSEAAAAHLEAGAILPLERPFTTRGIRHGRARACPGMGVEVRSAWVGAVHALGHQAEVRAFIVPELRFDMLLGVDAQRTMGLVQWQHVIECDVTARLPEWLTRVSLMDSSYLCVR